MSLPVQRVFSTNLDRSVASSTPEGVGRCSVPTPGGVQGTVVVCRPKERHTAVFAVPKEGSSGGVDGIGVSGGQRGAFPLRGGGGGGSGSGGNGSGSGSGREGHHLTKGVMSQRFILCGGSATAVALSPPPRSRD